MITPANRVGKVEEYYFSKKLREIAELNAKGADVLNLGIGNPDGPPHKDVIQKLHESSAQPNTHGYQSYQGIPEIRQAYADWYQKFYRVTLNPQTEVLPLIGSKEGILHTTMAYVNPGDQVLVPNPGYPTYSSIAKLAGAELVYYNLTDTNNWYPDFDELEKLDLSRCKIMWVNYPNMPTGTPATPELFEKLVAFGKKHNILICNDNPYSFILNDNPISILEVPGAMDVCIELNSLSKSHNMAGWRMGMVAGKAEHIQYILRFKSNVDSGMYRPLQEAAVVALNLGEDWYQKVNAEYTKRKVLACEIMTTLGCVYDEKQTGMFIWAKVPDTSTGEVLANKVLDDARVFITPGFIFGNNGEQYIRISLCSSETMLKKALKRIQENI